MDFQTWLTRFLEEKNIDMSEPVTAGDGSMIFAGDVFSIILKAPNKEQFEVKRILTLIDFHNGDVMHFVRHLAKAITEKDVKDFT